MIRRFILVLWVFVLAFSCTTKEDQLSGMKVFRYNQADGLSSLDPAFARNQANIWATSQLYNGLFELSSDMYPVKCLADSWEIENEGKEYTFKIKEGVYFHDNQVFPEGKGREIKAQDFVYSFKRILDPATASTGVWIFSDKVKKDDQGNIAEDWIVAIDDYSLKITLDQPFGAFLEILTMPYTFVVPKEAVEKYGKEFRTHPVGTGPFMLKSWTEGNNLALVKNNSYWKKDVNGNKLPYLDAVLVTFISDKSQELRTFEQKKLDLISFSGQANTIDMILNKDGSIREDFSERFVIEKIPYMNTEYIGFCMNSKLYDKDHPVLNKKFRQAMNYGIDRKGMVAYMLNNLGKPGTSGIIPPAITGFNDNKIKGYQFDQSQAEQLLREAGYPEGKNLPVIELYTTIQSKPYVEYIQKQWEAIGVKVEIKINPVATHQELIDNARVNFFRGSWLGDYPDAENYLAMFYSKNYAPNGPNKTHFLNEEFDKLYESAKLEPDGFKRLDYYIEMDRIIMEEAPVIVLFYDEALRLSQKNLVGLEMNPMNIPKLEKVDFIDTTAVEEKPEIQVNAI